METLDYKYYILTGVSAVKPATDRSEISESVSRVKDISKNFNTLSQVCPIYIHTAVIDHGITRPGQGILANGVLRCNIPLFNSTNTYCSRDSQMKSICYSIETNKSGGKGGGIDYIPSLGGSVWGMHTVYFHP